MSAHPAAHVPGLTSRRGHLPHSGSVEARDLRTSRLEIGIARQGDPHRRALDDRETRMSNGVGASPPRSAARPDEPHEFVQLLTPDGERVSHPDYDVDFTDEELRGLYRDLVVIR